MNGTNEKLKIWGCRAPFMIFTVVIRENSKILKGIEEERA